MIRPEVKELLSMGPLPDSASAAEDIPRLEQYQRLVESISKPVSDEEAEALAGLFGPDESFGLAWALLHLIESAPGWPLLDGLPNGNNEWVRLLRDRAER